ncbi:MAG TPA: hypothetical protein PK006_08975 [Saprospiraceae bacterium]|nr:hypothetical protein [Saprospiraceae bacterium]
MKNYLLFILFAISFLISGCESTDPGPSVQGPSEYTITMDKGFLANQSIVLTNTASNDDVHFLSSFGITHIKSESLEEKSNNRLDKKFTFIDFGWTGGTTTGTKEAVSATNELAPSAGDITLTFLNGDELIVNGIPKGSPVTVSNYNAIGEDITGELNFITRIDYSHSGQLKFADQCKIKLAFKLKRGANK